MLLLITAMVGGGLDIRPAPSGGCSIASDDHAPAPQPREESSDESAEDEETTSGKHAALGAAISLDWPAPRGTKLCECPARLATLAHLGTAPIRGPPFLA